MKKENALNDFRKWLESDAFTGESKASRDLYKSYVKRALEEINKDKKYGKDFICIDIKKNKKNAEKELLLIERILTKWKNDSNEKNDKKRFQNWLSGYRMFKEFLQDDEKESNYIIVFNEKAKKKIDKLKNTDIKFIKKDLKSNFKLRLTTQGRKEDKKSLNPEKELMYPIRLVTKILNKSNYNDEYDKFLDDEIDNIEFVIDKNRKRIKFKNLDNEDSLTITGKKGEVYIKVKDKKYKLYTYKNLKDEPRPLTVFKGIEDTSLDHEPAIDKVLNRPECIEKCIRLKELTKIMFGERKNFDKMSSHKATRDIYDNYKIRFDNAFCEELLDEIKLISKNTGCLTFLDRGDNSSKSNK